MRYCAKMFLCLLVLSLVFFSSCSPSDTGDTGGITETTPYEPTPAELYEAACEKLRQADHLLLSYTYSASRTVGEETFSQQITGTSSLCDLGSDAMEALVQQRLSYGTFAADYTELYHEGTAYATVHGSSFSAAMTVEDFIARQLPWVVLSSRLYGEITAAETEETTSFAFTQPSAPESWEGCPI